MTDRYYELTQKQQNSVLQLMQVIPQNDIDVLIGLLQVNGWSMDEAVMNFMAPPPVAPVMQPQPQYPQPGNDYYDDIQPYQQPHEDYAFEGKSHKLGGGQFVERKIQRRVSDMYAPAPPILKKINTSISPEKQEPPNIRDVRITQRNKQFILHLRKQYKSTINFRFGTLQQNFKQAQKRGRKLLIYLQPFNDYAWQATIRSILSTKQVIDLLNTQYLCFGLFQNSPDTQILQKYINYDLWPCMAVVDCSGDPKVERTALIRQGRPVQDIIRVLTGKEQEKLPILQPKQSQKHSKIISDQNDEYSKVIKELQAYQAAKKAEQDKQKAIKL